MNWWQYLMLVNIYLLLFYSFYALLLSRETFFQLNRTYLVAGALLSFFIPLIQSDWVKNLFITQKVKLTIYGSPVMFYQFKPIEHTQITVGQILVTIYLAGIVFLLARFAWHLIVLNKVIDRPQPSAPYSFFKKINLGDNIENQEVIATHELVHANQWHSADVLLIEAVVIINWFNPVVYLYRFAIKHIHEFIADREALKSGTDKADYALLLLSQTFNTPAHQLVNPFFNHSLLKQRIVMLQKNRSHRVALFKYCLSAPLFVLMLVLSSATVNNSKPIRLITKKARQVFLAPADEVIDIKTNDFTPNGTNQGGQVKNVEGYGSKKVLLFAKNDTLKKRDGKVFTSVEQVPEFPGGIEAFFNFLSKNIKYPAQARKNNIQGKVIISFIVETDGSLSGAKVLRGIGYGTDDEALRVIKLSPNWRPGIQNGKPVRVSYSVPISFTLADAKPQKENKTGAVNENKNTLDGSSTIVPAAGNMDTGKMYAQNGLKTSSPLSSSVSVLYIVDGRRVSDLSGINADEIQSINVLKDKSATDIYGQKAANGVVIVTMKKNKAVGLKGN